MIEKNFSPKFRSYSTRAIKFKKISKKIQKNKKTSFWHYIYPHRDEIGRENEKKILFSNSVPKRPRLEYSKKNSKKIQKNEKHQSGIISIKKTGLDRPRKMEKSFSPEFRSLSTRARKFQKKLQKIFKKLKTSLWHYFSRNQDEIDRESVKKILIPNSIPTRPGLEN